MGVVTVDKQELDAIKFRLDEGYWGGRVCVDTGCPLKHDCKALLAEIDRLQIEWDAAVKFIKYFHGQFGYVMPREYIEKYEQWRGLEGRE